MVHGKVSPLDGGWGWVIVGCCFMVTVCTRAVTRCVSIFFVEFQAHFGADYSATAWIHSLVDCTTMLCAPVGSLVGNRWSHRVAVMLGGLLSSCGLLLSSFTNSLETLYFSMGVLTGLGFALCYTPTIVMVSCYFQRRKALAYGIAMSGSGIGTFVLAPAVQMLIELYSWRGALLILSAFVSNLCVCGALLRPITVLEEDGEEATPGRDRLGNVSKHDSELTTKVSKESDSLLSSCTSLPPSLPSLPPLLGSPAPQLQRRWCFSSCFLSSQEYRFLLLPDFLGLAVSFLFLASGCSLPFVYLVPYALSIGISHQHAAFLMSILGVIDIVGNITFGWLTDRRCLKPYRVACYVFSVWMEGLCCLFTPLLRSFPLLVPFAVLYGYFDGAYVALIPVVTSDVVGAPYLSSALGVVYFMHAIPYLISPPIGGSSPPASSAGSPSPPPPPLSSADSPSPPPSSIGSAPPPPPPLPSSAGSPSDAPVLSERRNRNETNISRVQIHLINKIFVSLPRLRIPICVRLSSRRFSFSDRSACSSCLSFSSSLPCRAPP